MVVIFFGCIHKYGYIHIGMSWCIRIKYKNQDCRAAKKLGNKSYSKVNSVRKHSFGTNGSNFQADHKLWKRNEKTSSKPSELYTTPGRLKLLTTSCQQGSEVPARSTLRCQGVGVSRGVDWKLHRKQLLISRPSSCCQWSKTTRTKRREEKVSSHSWKWYSLNGTASLKRAD